MMYVNSSVGNREEAGELIILEMWIVGLSAFCRQSTVISKFRGFTIVTFRIIRFCDLTLSRKSPTSIA